MLAILSVPTTLGHYHGEGLSAPAPPSAPPTAPPLHTALLTPAINEGETEDNAKLIKRIIIMTLLLVYFVAQVAAVLSIEVIEVRCSSLVCQIKTEYLLPVLTSAICSHQPLTFGRSYRAM